MKDNKTKVITLAALVVAIIALSIGFAAFASTLNIQTSASVSPNDTFVVKFSNSNSELSETNVTASSGSQYGGSATIDNSDVKNPTIGNLSASFTQPGQSVTYTFYVRNMGDYDAYLTAVNFNNATGKQVFKSCTSSGSNPGTQTIVDTVCDDITFTLELEASPNKVLTSESNFATAVGNDYIVPKSSTPNSGTTNSKMVTVTIAYPQGSNYADGSFTVNFGSVEMIFATLAGFAPTPATPEQVAIDISGTYNRYLVPSSNPTTLFMFYNDNTGKVALNMGEDMEVPLTYSYDSSTNIITVNVMGNDQYLNYLNIENNQVVYSIEGRDQFIFSTNGGEGITPLEGFVYSYNGVNDLQFGSTITFGPNGSYTDSYNSSTGSYGVIDEYLLMLDSSGSLTVISIAQDYSSFSDYIKQND